MPGRAARRRRFAARLVRVLLAFAAPIAGAGGALAQTIQEQSIDCKDAAGVALSSDACAEQAWKKADKDLNELYRRLRATLPEDLAPPYARDDVLKQLAAIQKLWVQLRDADCDLYEGMSGGGNTGHFNYQYQCYLDRTLKRIAELQAFERMVSQ